jgi:hypothetical protein
MAVASIKGTDTSYTDKSVSYGSAYCYLIAGTKDGQTATLDSSVITSAVHTGTAPTTGDTTRPTLSSTSLSVNGGFSGQVDSGDTIKLVATKPLAFTANSASILVKDSDGTFATLTDNGTTVKFSIDSSDTTGKTLLITLTTNPTVSASNPGTVPGVQVPATIVDSSGITDTTANANALSLASGDVTIN